MRCLTERFMRGTPLWDRHAREFALGQQHDPRGCRAHRAARVRFPKETGSPEMMTSVGPPVMLAREVAAAAAGEPRRLM